MVRVVQNGLNCSKWPDLTKKWHKLVKKKWPNLVKKKWPEMVIKLGRIGQN